MFRSGAATMSEAVRKGEAAWTIEDEVVLRERALGTTYLGILVRETGEIWLTALPNFLDREKVRIINYTGRGGSLQRCLPFAHFARQPGRIAKL